MFPQLNPYQGRQLTALLRSDVIQGGAFRVKHFPGRCAGLAYVEVMQRGLPVNVGMLWPAARPLPGDPLFQRPVRLDANPLPFLACIHIAQPAMRRDWQWRDCIDVPDLMPAGSTAGFDHGDDVYGAALTDCWREP